MGYQVEQELVSTLKVQRKIAALPFFGVLNSHKTTSNQCLTSSFLILKGTMVSVAIDWTLYLSSVTKITIVLNKRNKCLLQNAIEGPNKVEIPRDTSPLQISMYSWSMITEYFSLILPYSSMGNYKSTYAANNHLKIFKQASLQKLATNSIKQHPLLAAKDPCSKEVMKFIHR